MNPWTSGAFALGGIGLGWILTTLTEKSRRRHARRTHWLDLRRELGVRFVDATDNLQKWSLALSNIASAKPGEPTIGIDGVTTVVEAMHRQGEAYHALGALATEMELIGTPAERAAAERLTRLVSEASTAYAAAVRLEGEERALRLKDSVSTYSLARAARNDFLSTMRRGLLGESTRHFWQREPQAKPR